jgi:hypothetical protein
VGVAAGNWFTASNRNPAAVPGASATAIVGNGGEAKVNGSGSISVNRLEVGKNAGTGRLTDVGVDILVGVDFDIGEIGGTFATGPFMVNSNGSATFSDITNLKVGTTGVGDLDIGQTCAASGASAVGTGLLTIQRAQTVNVPTDMDTGQAGGSAQPTGNGTLTGDTIQSFTVGRVINVGSTSGSTGVQARRQRTRTDFARFVRDVVKRYPHTRWIHLVLDNLDTYNPTSLVETFGEGSAQKLLKRIVWHYTPKHANWLNMAEIELSVLTQQCLGRRVPTLEHVQQHVAAWSRYRNRQKLTIDWTFKRTDARRVFPELYRPKLVT